MKKDMHPLARMDHQYAWHPFTQMQDWLQREPVVIRSGQGATLRDVHGRRYLDGNASIWTNLHGHNHPKINQAIQQQLGRLAHCSFLGLANEPASKLASRLVAMANPPQFPLPRDQNPERKRRRTRPGPPQPALGKVFFSDDGSTALEVALKMAYEYSRRTGQSQKPSFLSLQGAYHGDTIGAVSLGHIDLFHKAYAGLLFRSDTVMAPYCYRCPFNRARPERGDARDYRRCAWECLGQVERKLARRAKRGQPYSALVLEPLMQGAAGMIPQPAGWLSQVGALARSHHALLIADEVMTGFGRTGALFACHQEGVQPDFLALAKGLTGGYLPMAATLTTLEVFKVFLGKYEEFKTFFHGHSYTGNALGAAAALASLSLVQSRASQRDRMKLETVLRESLRILWALPCVGDIRQVGCMVGVELVKDWRTREPFELRDQAGIRVCEAMRRRGVLTRPIGNVLVLMPPYCTTPAQAQEMVETMRASIEETL